MAQTIPTAAILPAIAAGLTAACLVGLPAAARAQAAGRPVAPTVVVPPGAPGVFSRQPGSTGAPGAYNYSPTGQPADVISNDSAAAGNASQPTLVAPQGGGGGGSGGR